jgi:hypothetical protein
VKDDSAVVRRLCALLFGLPWCFSAAANCDFQTGAFIDKLNDPSSLSELRIEVPKSGKFNKNFAKIITSSGRIITPEQKKKFRARIYVQYEFGECQYEGTVRQSGDWKDHVKMGLKPLRSVDVSLREGNVLGAVKFKLLIPETRGDLNEILGPLLLRRLGFIAPETFHLLAEVNGSRSLMLFQENAAKELLERNGRREGPLFEGDESLIWKYQDFNQLELEDVSLARVTNSKWFERGSNSKTITLESLSRLQGAYLRFATGYQPWNRVTIFPNGPDDRLFASYSLILEAMNGHHGLFPHNRRFYFNIFENRLEPIYYDGDLNLTRPFKRYNKNKADHPYPDDSLSLIDKIEQKIQEPKFIEHLRREFNERVLDSVVGEEFLEASLINLSLNFERLRQNIQENPRRKFEPVLSFDEHYSKFIQNHRSHQLSQFVLYDVKRGENGFEALVEETLTGNKVRKNITSKEMRFLISKNLFNKHRAVFLPKNLDLGLLSSVKDFSLPDSISFESFKGSNGVSIRVDEGARVIKIFQKYPTDWVLFSGVVLEDWTIKFYGIAAGSELQGQRFNEHGMTGCLNFYRTIFSGVGLEVVGGQCEDSLNIVNSTGTLESVRVKDAFSDAVDIDFSEIEFSTIEVETAGNDCLDVSGGIYSLGDAQFVGCADKAISVGERSNLVFRRAKISTSRIGVAIKDFSTVEGQDWRVNDTEICVDVSQKKQEFGGAQASVPSDNCSGSFQVDKHSILQ